MATYPQCRLLYTQNLHEATLQLTSLGTGPKQLEHNKKLEECLEAVDRCNWTAGNPQVVKRHKNPTIFHGYTFYRSLPGRLPSSADEYFYLDDITHLLPHHCESVCFAFTPQKNCIRIQLTVFTPASTSQNIAQRSTFEANQKGLASLSHLFIWSRSNEKMSYIK